MVDKSGNIGRKQYFIVTFPGNRHLHEDSRDANTSTAVFEWEWPP